MQPVLNETHLPTNIEVGERGVSNITWSVLHAGSSMFQAYTNFWPHSHFLYGPTPIPPVGGQTGTPTSPPSHLSAAEQAQLSGYAVPIIGARRVSQLLRPHKQLRSIYETGEREAASVHRPGLTPSGGREGAMSLEQHTRALAANFEL